MPAPATISALLVVLSVTMPAATAQRGPVHMGGTGFGVSPTVVATWVAHQDGSGATRLDLLVLWRGTPGWFKRAGGGDGSNGGSSGRDGAQVVTMGIRYGTIQYHLALDLQARRVTVGQREVVLGNNNVLLIDDVDSDAGARIVGMQQVDPVIPDRGVGIFLRQLPELSDYLGR